MKTCSCCEQKPVRKPNAKYCAVCAPLVIAATAQLAGKTRRQAVAQVRFKVLTAPPTPQESLPPTREWLDQWAEGTKQKYPFLLLNHGGNSCGKSFRMRILTAAMRENGQNVRVIA